MLLWSIVGCSCAGRDETGGASDSDVGPGGSCDWTTGAGPTVASSDTCPLVPILSFSAPTPVSLRITDAAHDVSSPAATSHAVALFDFVAGTPTSFHVEVTDDVGCAAGWDVAWTAPALPALWPDVELAVGQPASMSPGLTVMPVGTLMPGGDHYLAAFDAAGKVRWLFDGDTLFDDFEVTSEGTLLYLDGAGMTEMDWACNPVAQFTWEGSGGTGIAIDGTVLFHHDGSKLSDGTYLVLDHELATFEDFPVDYDDLNDTDEADVDVTAVVRFDGTGTVLDRISFADAFDPERIGWDALNDGEYFQQAYDWVHGNAAQWIESENQYLLSARQQDAVVLWDADTDEVVWVLANSDNWSADFDDLRLGSDGSVDWFYHQHAPWLADDGTLILFDNGNVRTSPPDEPSGTPYSRAVGYRVDGATVSQEWEYHGPSNGEMFCSAGGDVDTLANGNILAVCSFGKTIDGVAHEDVGLGNSCARVMEFDPATGATFYDLRLTSQAAENANGWYTVRAARVSAIGP